MKHTQSFLQGALSKGEDWIKNAGHFMHRHRYVIGGAMGGAMLAMAHMGGGERPPRIQTYDHLGGRYGVGRAPNHAIATGAREGPPVLLGNMRGIHSIS